MYRVDVEVEVEVCGPITKPIINLIMVCGK